MEEPFDTQMNYAKPGFKCTACGIETDPLGDCFMVKKNAWKHLRVDLRYKMFCIICLGNRHGCPLKKSDFYKNKVTESYPFPHRDGNFDSLSNWINPHQ